MYTITSENLEIAIYVNAVATDAPAFKYDAFSKIDIHSVFQTNVVRVEYQLKRKEYAVYVVG